MLQDLWTTLYADYTPLLGGSLTLLLEEAITEEKVKRAVTSFSAFKSPGQDGIHPITLQAGRKTVLGRRMPTF